MVPGATLTSLCQPWQPQIEAAVAVGLSAQRIYQDLVGDCGFSGSYQAVKRFVRQLRQTQPIPFVRDWKYTDDDPRVFRPTVELLCWARKVMQVCGGKFAQVFL